MEVYLPCNTPACLAISSSVGSSKDPHNLIQDDKGLSMNDLKTCLTEVLNIEDIKISTSGFNLSSGKSDIGNVLREYECTELDKNTPAATASEKCFSKSATLPPCGGPESPRDVFIGEKGKQNIDVTAEVSEVNGPAEPFNECYSRSISLPIPAKLVSAMKGSREKLGTPPKKLSVTWAPEVYDPIPTSVSHVPSNKNQRHRSDSKRSGKYKQKGSGKSSRGSKGKDKKQSRKNVGGSIKLKPFHEDSGVNFVEPQVATVDFNVGSPDPFCGSSFLKKSVAKLHFPVAEAT